MATQKRAFPGPTAVVRDIRDGRGSRSPVRRLPVDSQGPYAHWILRANAAGERVAVTLQSSEFDP